jgi:hypothetical protein
MKTNSWYSKLAIAVLGAFLIASCQDSVLDNIAPNGDAASKKPTGPGQTGQSIMIDADLTGTYLLAGSETWKFKQDKDDKDEKYLAEAYYTNTLTSGPEIVPGNGQEPTTPTAPDPIYNELRKHVFQNEKCTFFNGGSLNSTTYTQFLTKPGGWKYTWTYTVAPLVENVAPRTEWELMSSTSSGSAIVDIDGLIAGLSARTWTSDGGIKYSFSLTEAGLDGDGNPIEISRILNLAITVTDGDGNIVSQFAPEHNIITERNPDPVDFTYLTNAGTNGNTSILPVGSVDARTLLNNDAFDGNDNGGSDGKALQADVFVQQLEFTESGNYNITITATVKGNSGLSDQNI